MLSYLASLIFIRDLRLVSIRAAGFWVKFQSQFILLRSEMMILSNDSLAIYFPVFIFSLYEDNTLITETGLQTSASAFSNNYISVCL